MAAERLRAGSPVQFMTRGLIVWDLARGGAALSALIILPG
jgi:hypothetical protein